MNTTLKNLTVVIALLLVSAVAFGQTPPPASSSMHGGAATPAKTAATVIDSTGSAAAPAASVTDPVAAPAATAADTASAVTPSVSAEMLEAQKKAKDAYLDGEFAKRKCSDCIAFVAGIDNISDQHYAAVRLMNRWHNMSTLQFPVIAETSSCTAILDHLTEQVAEHVYLVQKVDNRVAKALQGYVPRDEFEAYVTRTAQLISELRTQVDLNSADIETNGINIVALKDKANQIGFDLDRALGDDFTYEPLELDSGEDTDTIASATPAATE